MRDEEAVTKRLAGGWTGSRATPLSRCRNYIALTQTGRSQAHVLKKPAIKPKHLSFYCSTTSPAEIVPHPTNLQCFNILLDKATFSPISVQAGEISVILAKSALTLVTFPPVDVDPMLTMSTSPFVSLATLVCFLSSDLTPSKRRSRK